MRKPTQCFVAARKVSRVEEGKTTQSKEQTSKHDVPFRALGFACWGG